MSKIQKSGLGTSAAGRKGQRNPVPIFGSPPPRTEVLQEAPTTDGESPGEELQQTPSEPYYFR
jgi:hypothetical protein